MNPSNLSRAWLPALAACTALLGCQQRVIEPDREAGGSDEIDTRLAVDAKGRPVSGARIALVRVGDSTGRLAALSSTGSDGQYPSFQVADGAYSATVRDAQDSLGKFLDTLQISGGKAKVGRDTLLALGKIRGVVRLVGGETPASVIMSLYGTDIAANVRKDGTFEIDLVPGGLFTLMGSTSLDGYGTLLRRLQLRDGQDLVIPDTLSLPVTGLLAPAQIWAESDTGTGDVRVRWNQVDHPNRMGYVLERLENGVVTRSQFLTDTVWKDSLKDYWEGLPLLGPWPSREAVYRVRTRALNGAGDTRSVAQSFLAKAPEWTKRIDSLGMVMTTDTAAEISRFRWKPFQHPNVTGWRMVRLADGVEDCSGIPVGGAWSDSGCKSATLVVIDSTQPNSPNKSKVYQQKQPLLTYQLVGIQKQGRAIAFSASRQTKLKPWIEWEESEDPGFGGWKTKGDNVEEVRMASKIGGKWENLEYFWYQKIIGWGDSLWNVWRIDSLHLSVSSRNSEGGWTKRIVPMNHPLSEFELSLNQGALEVYGNTLLGEYYFGRLDADSLRLGPSPTPNRSYLKTYGGKSPVLYPISANFFYEGTENYRDLEMKLEVSQVDEGSKVQAKNWQFHSTDWYAIFECGLDKASFVWKIEGVGRVFQNWNGDGYVVQMPIGLKSSQGRCLSVDGTLYYREYIQLQSKYWKAKLNFPSSR